MLGSLAWTELPGGADCRATGRFYARVFGWLVADDNDMVRFRDPAGALAGAFLGDLPPAPLGGPTLYLSADDIDPVLAAAEAQGATVVHPRTLIAPGVGYRALIRDPAGSIVGIFEPWRESAAGS